MLKASAVVNIHREALLLTPTMNSLRLAKQNAQAAGYEVELLIVADRSDAATLAIVEKFSDIVDRVIPVEFGDLGASREYGIAQAKNDWVFMHDADDLFSSNWYLQFFDMWAAGDIDERTVYHTDLFARFGNTQDIRQMIDSWDPRFHPLFLASEWYYSNKAVLNRKLFDEFPMPYNDTRTGIGNEDWTWSCHTIQKGIRHYKIPKTICFYRVKPVADSMGLNPGMIHAPSPLFEPENILQGDIHRAGQSHNISAFNDNMVKKGDPVIGDGLPPGWFWHEVAIQQEFESLISDYHSFPHGELRVHLPNLHFNVVSATQHLMRDMDERPKIFIFATMDNLRAPDRVVEQFLTAARDYQGQSYQPVLVVDEGDHVFSDFGLMGKYGAKLICTAHFRQFYKVEEWYYNRLLMRPMVQSKDCIVIDLGSDTFAQLFDEFHRVILENAVATYAVLMYKKVDLLAAAPQNIANNVAFAHAHNGKDLRVLVRPELVPEFQNSYGWNIAVWPDILTETIEQISRQRYRAITDHAQLELAPILDAPLLPATQTSREIEIPEKFGVEVLGEGDVIVLRLSLGRKISYLYQTSSTWVSGEWYEIAHRFLHDNKHIWLVPPQISASLPVTGAYRCRWNDFSAPQKVFSGWYDQLSGNDNTPVCVITRELISADLPASPAQLAKSLYYYCADETKKASASGESIAIAMDPLRYRLEA